MLPIPARGAVLAFFGSVAMLLVAMLWSSPTVASLAGGALLGLAAALALTMPVGARLRRQRLELAWWLGHGAPGHGSGSGGAVAGTPFEVRGYLRNRDSKALRMTDLLPVVPRGVDVLIGLGCELTLPARSRTELRFRLTASAAGRVVLQGLAVAVPGPLGLFLSPLYFPSPLTIKVLPRTALQASSRARVAGAKRWSARV